MFSAWGTEPADPLDPNKNIIGFSYKDGAYEFEQTVQKGTQNFLQIAADATVPAGKAMIGIGMSENCIRCVPAVPNVVQKFELPSEYRVAFGSMKQDDPVDEEIVKQNILLKFPPNIFHLTVTLKEDNTWSQPE